MNSGGPIPKVQLGNRRLAAFAAASAALILCFFQPLYRLAQFAISNDLYSYILLIPPISVYLIWLKRSPVDTSCPSSRWQSVFLFSAGLIAIAAYWGAILKGVKLQTEDSLALTSVSFVLLFFGICGWFLSGQTILANLFSIGLLVLMVPFPAFLRSWMENSLQHWSSLAAVGMFDLAGTPVFNVGNNLQLSNIELQVAPECSGIHSSVALFITSLIAGHFFLKSNWKRSLLAFAVVPLGILRNGFRVFTIGELCVHIGPQMIDSDIHHKGGPIFFALSLVPFLFFLYLLIRSESHNKKPRSISNKV